MGSTEKGIQVVVRISFDALGRVKSSHRLSDTDFQVAASWPTGGQAQIVHGLLFEALRREVLLSMGMILQHDKEWLSRLQEMAEEDRKLELKDLADKVYETMRKSLVLLVESAVNATFNDVARSRSTSKQGKM